MGFKIDSNQGKYIKSVIENYNKKCNAYQVDVNDILKTLENFSNDYCPDLEKTKGKMEDIYKHRATKDEYASYYQEFYEKQLKSVEDRVEANIKDGVGIKNVNYLAEFEGMMQEIFNSVYLPEIGRAKQNHQMKFQIDLDNTSMKFGEFRKNDEIYDPSQKIANNIEKYSAKSVYINSLENKLSYNSDTLTNNLKEANNNLDLSKVDDTKVKDFAVKYAATREHYNNRNWFSKLFAFSERSALNSAREKLETLCSENENYVKSTVDSLVESCSKSIASKYAEYYNAHLPEEISKGTDYKEFQKAFYKDIDDATREMNENKREKGLINPQRGKLTKEDKFIREEYKKSVENKEDFQHKLDDIYSGKDSISNIDEDDIGVFKIDDFVNEGKSNRMTEEAQLRADLAKQTSELSTSQKSSKIENAPKIDAPNKSVDK